MVTRVTRGVGLVAALAVAAGIAWVSNVPFATVQQGDAVLRLSWSARPERVETCRARTAEEQAQLPDQLRQSLICEGESATYRLQVWRDGNLALDEQVRGGGWRHDRPLYVFREIPQPSGDVLLKVQLERIDSPSAVNTTLPGVPVTRAISDLPRSVVFEQRVHVDRGRVILVTYDPERHAFVTAGG